MNSSTASDTRKPVTIRLARVADVERLAVLCGQLGYPSSQEQVRRRLLQILGDEDHAVYVAEGSEGRVIGWVHVYVSRLLEADPQAEIGGLVVDESHHGRGVGRLLMGQVEGWARQKGCWAIHVRSNVIRKGAHAFYERVDYSHVKTQRVFRKAL